MPNRSDPELMRLVQEKRREALEELYDRYVKLVFSFALRAVNNEAMAREIVQEVFTRLWTTGAGFDSRKGQFVNWLLTITRNITVDLIRRERRQAFRVSISAELWEQLPDTTGDTPEEAAVRDSQREHIRYAVRLLSESQQQLIELLYWKGYTLSEIAEYIGQPLGTVKSRLHQTLKKLRKHLRDAKEE